MQNLITKKATVARKKKTLLGEKTESLSIAPWQAERQQQKLNNILIKYLELLFKCKYLTLSYDKTHQENS